MTDTEGASNAPLDGVFTTLSQDKCRQLLEVAVIGRIAFQSKAGLELLPINYLYLDGSVYVRVDRASVFGELAGGVDEVAFLADHHEDLYQRAWSVSVKGSIEAVTDATELSKLAAKRQLKPWAIGERNLYLRLVPTSISGRSVIHYAR